MCGGGGGGGRVEFDHGGLYLERVVVWPMVMVESMDALVRMSIRRTN